MAYWYAHLGFLILLTAPLPIRSEPDVPVGVALMDQNPVLVEGYDAELSCRFHGAPRAVSYHKDVVGIGLLIIWYEQSGLEHESGKYNITDAYSLVIHEVTASDAGRYYCRVSDSRGITIGNNTDAKVQTAPRAPFPTIDQCPTSNESPCTLYVNHTDDAINLICRAEGASRGLVSLLWSRSGNSEGLQQQNRISAHQDGRTETVEATIEVLNSSDLYVCTAILHAPRFEYQTASVTVWVPIATTTSTTTTTTTAVPPNTGRQTLNADPDVPVGVALMDQNPVLVEGYDAELSCRFHGTPRIVSYHKDVVGIGLLIIWYEHTGLGYESGKYNITDAYSLVIHEVTASDAGRYYCRVSDSRGIIIGNDTDATVQTAPQAPFPTIDQCPTDTESPCSLYVKHSDDAVNLTCRAEGASTGLVSLLWSHSDNSEGLQQQNRISAHQDGRTEMVEATIEVQYSSEPYICTAIVHATRFENRTASVTVRLPIATTSMTTTTTTTTTTAVPPNAGRQTLNAVHCLLIVVFILIIIIIIVAYVGRKTLKSLKCPLFRSPEGDPLSYIELCWLCKTVPDLHALAAATRKLRGQPDETLGYTDFEYVPSRRELYNHLCCWKEGTGSEGEELCQRQQLNEALKEKNINTGLEEFRTSNEEISDDDLEYICRSVCELPKRVKPVLTALGFKKQRSTDNDAPAWPIPLRQQERPAAVEEDMQSLLEWRAVVRGANEMYADENIGSSERVVFVGTHDGGEVSFPLKGLNERADGEGLNGRRAGSVNERVVMCRALEQADKRDSRYRQVAKNFSLHALNDASSKRNPTEEEVKFPAIAINRRHCLKLNEKVKLSPDKCKENHDVLFGSHGMLEDWGKEQMCSSYEIRCRLRAAAERAGREDIADMAIRKESVIDPSEPAQISINQECSTDKTDQPGVRKQQGGNKRHQQTNLQTAPTTYNKAPMKTSLFPVPWNPGTWNLQSRAMRPI